MESFEESGGSGDCRSRNAGSPEPLGGVVRALRTGTGKVAGESPFPNWPLSTLL